MTANVLTGLSPLPMPEYEKEPKSFNRRNVLRIHASTNRDSVFVENVLTPISEVTGIVENKLLSDCSDTLNPEKKLICNGYLPEFYR